MRIRTSSKPISLYIMGGLYIKMVDWKDEDEPDFKVYYGKSRNVSLDELKTLYLKIMDFEDYIWNSFSKLEMSDLHLWNPFMLAKTTIRNCVAHQKFKEWREEALNEKR